MVRRATVIAAAPGHRYGDAVGRMRTWTDRTSSAQGPSSARDRCGAHRASVHAEGTLVCTSVVERHARARVARVGTAGDDRRHRRGRQRGRARGRRRLRRHPERRHRLLDLPDLRRRSRRRATCRRACSASRPTAPVTYLTPIRRSTAAAAERPLRRGRRHRVLHRSAVADAVDTARTGSHWTRHSEPDGSLRLVADGFWAPNGIILDVDGETLIVVENGRHGEHHGFVRLRGRRHARAVRARAAWATAARSTSTGASTWPAVATSSRSTNPTAPSSR